MASIVVHVASSDGVGSYKVTIEGGDKPLRMFCNCGAGLNGSYCRHRFQLLDGVIGEVVSDNASDLAPLAGWRAGSAVEAAYSERMAAEADLKRAKARIAAANKSMARAMHGS